MKRFLKVALAVSAFALVSNVSAYAQKFGYINTAELIESMPEMEDVRTKYEAFEKDMEDTWESMTVEFNNKWNDYSKVATTLSDAVREIREDELQKLRDRINQFEQSAQYTMQQEYTKLMSPLFEKAREGIEKVSRSNNFIVVFEVGPGNAAILYYDEAQMTDVLPLVQRELGITPKN